MEAHVADWLDSIRSTLRRSHVADWFRSLFACISKRTGAGNPTLQFVINYKLCAIAEEIVTQATRAGTHAATLPPGAVKQLEHISCNCSPADSMLASAFRFVIGGSARLDDTKHALATSRRLLPSTVGNHLRTVQDDGHEQGKRVHFRS